MREAHLPLCSLLRQATAHGRGLRLRSRQEPARVSSAPRLTGEGSITEEEARTQASGTSTAAVRSDSRVPLCKAHTLAEFSSSRLRASTEKLTGPSVRGDERRNSQSCQR